VYQLAALTIGARLVVADAHAEPEVPTGEAEVVGILVTGCG